MPITDEAPPQEEKIIQTQTGDSVGKLAGDLAHDINDILTVITGYANYLLNSEGCPEDMQEPLRQIYVAGSRATDLTRDLMSFSARNARKAPTNGAAHSSGAHGAVNGGGETILLVEDEDPVREFASAVLRRYGYRVLQARSGADALDVWKWHSPRITLLLTDLVMHDDMTGIELARKLLAEKPDLGVICTSGYGEDRLEQGSGPPDGVHFLQKPYQPQRLAELVRDALGRGFQR